MYDFSCDTSFLKLIKIIKSLNWDDLDLCKSVKNDQCTHHRRLENCINNLRVVGIHHIWSTLKKLCHPKQRQAVFVNVRHAVSILSFHHVNQIYFGD